MTEKEIVKALRCCTDHSCSAKCPAYQAGLDCREEMHKAVLNLVESLTAENADRKALINELCQYCGKYKYAHDGACDGCRWKGET